eukprot:TRINITY_DN23041_c0_g1_i1.p2 TRINITY_DN23041_c0_g1~~TRINITY_DN23041_c0_g1_i1.p2  ORF type:complete len:150 (-),score=37.60 TRINITY_DN23041_c0_g1_i1:179-628(-)
MARKGVVLDDRVCTPMAAKYVVPAAADAALFNGFAAHEAEQERRVRYGRRHDAARYVFAPFVQECFGRLGQATRAFIARLAAHSAACVQAAMAGWCSGGAVLSGGALWSPCRSAALARQRAERVLAYVRSAQLSGRTVDPVSVLLAGTR